MPSFRSAILLLLGAAAASPSDSLHVLRALPRDLADATDTVLVTFDRPVATQLGQTIDPRTFFKIEPAVAGKLEWRDPVTVVFAPARLLDAGTTYTVTLAANFKAADGSKLDGAYRFSFRVRGPRVLASAAVGGMNYLAPDAVLKVLVASPADPALLASLATLTLDAQCPTTTGSVKLKVVRQERPSRGDPDIGYSVPWNADSARMLPRLVVLAPEQPLPADCGGRFGVPERVDRDDAGPLHWTVFHTHGRLDVAAFGCADSPRCPTGPLQLRFTTPVRGSEVLQHVKLVPAVPFTVDDSSEERPDWTLDGAYTARTRYVIVVDSTISDVFGQHLPARVLKGFSTPGFTPTVRYPYGRMVVERNGKHTLGVQSVNVDTLYVLLAAVPPALEARASGQSWNFDDLWKQVLPNAVTRKVPVAGAIDIPRVTGVPLPPADPAGATLYLMKVGSPRADTVDTYRPTAIVQVTDLAIHARIGARDGAVWVTGVGDGLPRRGAKVTLYDNNGKERATALSDARGLAHLTGFGQDTAANDGGDEGDDECEYCYSGGFQGYVAVQLGADRAVLGLNNYDNDLNPWQFNVRGAWGPEREPSATAVFTERGIYRPGEAVYAKAIVRDGMLGALAVPARDSLRWVFHDREQGTLKDTTVALSAFGTADQRLPIAADAPLGYYRVEVRRKSGSQWRAVASASYRVAEYRPPEFLVHAVGDDKAKFAGDSFTAHVEGRYLFGAPMARAAVSWAARRRTATPWEYEVPNTDGWYVGTTGWWWEEYDWNQTPDVFATGDDTLDQAGHLDVSVPLDQPPKGKAAWVTIEATVTDVNRQAVAAQATVLVHPTSFYIGAKVDGDDYFWQVGKPRSVQLIAVTPEGKRVPGVAVSGALVRMEWHQVRRARAGFAETVGEWVQDTVSRCQAVTAADAVTCGFTPTQGGEYIVRFSASDDRRRDVATSFYRWVTGPDWVPWNDESQFKMDVVPNKTKYVVGDTATVLFAAPFTNAEAWVTVEREGLIAQRRIRITAGATTLKFPITEAYAPNAFVSIIVARGRSAPPGPPDDPGRPTIRVGYAELRVAPEVKRLKVGLTLDKPEYRPGDSTHVAIAVTDARGAGRRAEVTVWAVDEGVLSLTGYKTPDPIDLIYQPRGLGMRLASTMTTVAAQVVEGEKGKEPGGGGGMDVAGILRSQFQTTAFFLGSVVTDEQGRATAAAKLPDNLTTFRVMAVAVTAGDRYGSGETPLLVTRPLLARPALPRFLREGDAFTAGIVANSRLGGTPTVKVETRVAGATLNDQNTKTATLEAGRGREVRFGFQGIPGDTAVFQFKVSAAGEADAVETRLPIRPAYHPLAFTVAGALVDTATAAFTFAEPLDPARSRLEVSVGASPLAVIRGIQRDLEVYSWYCSEQVSSTALPLIALYQAQKQLGGAPLLRGDPRREIAQAVAMLSGRQRDDGGIGYWGNTDWTNAWLSAYAGRVLLAARSAGVPVSDTVLNRLADYLSGQLHKQQKLFLPIIRWYDAFGVGLSDQVSAADFLSRMGRPDIAAENTLLNQAAQLAWEDRVLLAEILARRRALDPARALLIPAWRTVKVEGHTAVLADTAWYRHFYFESTSRPLARLLTATLAVDPQNPLVGPMAMALAERGRAEAHEYWTTQDYAATVTGLLAFEWQRRQSAARTVRLRRGTTVLAQFGGGAVVTDTSFALTGLLADAGNGQQTVTVSLDAAGAGDPIFYYATVREVPLRRPVTPLDHGVRVERWYERFDSTHTPIQTIREGDLVRVRLRVTVSAERHFLVIDDALPAGLEAVDLSLRTTGALTSKENPGPPESERRYTDDEGRWYFGSWDYGWWSPWDHKEMHDERVVYFATTLWPGTYTATYVARATTPGVFVRPPAHAEEMYNPAVNGRSEGGTFTVTQKGP